MQSACAFVCVRADALYGYRKLGRGCCVVFVTVVDFVRVTSCTREEKKK